MHKDNPHQGNYDLKVLAKHHLALQSFIFKNEFGVETIKFSNPLAVKALNTAILKASYNIDFWEFDDKHLCPPIPSRADYLYELNDVIQQSNLTAPIKILDIGSGANCVFPLIGQRRFNWQFIASDVDNEAIHSIKKIIQKNNLEARVEVRHQNHTNHILRSVLSKDEKVTASICNPPFYKNEEEVIKVTRKKWKGLGKETLTLRNFSGQANELWYKGGELAFIKNYIYDSHLYKTNVAWFTSLVSNKEHLRPLKVALKQYKPAQVKVIKMIAGHKASHMLLWTYLEEDNFKTFNIN